jgi:hypothetical protein
VEVVEEIVLVEVKVMPRLVVPAVVVDPIRMLDIARD